MGRTIPSISARLDAKIAQWERFSKLLNAREREAFAKLVSVMRDHRTAIDAADEADIGIAVLLAMMVHLEAGRDARGVIVGREAGKRADLGVWEGTDRDARGEVGHGVKGTEREARNMGDMSKEDIYDLKRAIEESKDKKTVSLEGI